MTINEIIELKRIAFRSLMRHKMKTFLTCAGVMVSTALYIWMQSWLGGLMLESRRNIVNYEMGAAKVQTKLYFQNKDELPSYETFTGWEVYAKALENAGYNAAPRYTFSGTIYSQEAFAPVAVYGIEPDAEKRILLYADYVEFGRFVKNGEFQAVLGAMTAEKLKAGIPTRIPKDEFEMFVSGAADAGEAEFIRSCYSPMETNIETKTLYVLKRSIDKASSERLWNICDNAGRNDVRIATVIDFKDDSGKVRHVNQVIDLKIAGIINSPDPATNFNAVYVPLDVLQDEEGMMLQGAVTEILIRAKDAIPGSAAEKKESKEAIRAGLELKLAEAGEMLPAELDVYTWQEYNEDYLGYEKLESGSTKILSFLLFFLALIGISNTMLLAILERTKETGMMRALGMSSGQITAAYFFEALAIGFLGSILGVILGCILNYPMVKYGLDFSGMLEQFGGSMGYRISGNFRGMWDFPVIIFTPLVATLLSGLMAIAPVRRALRMNIIEVLRFE
ncbi:MAG: FtsX-like permease family protein [Spirochaetaceae bacterium]|jgi:ABC-type lipoprotein release transport system permease subunit|nr:FtsX-like permease family protein [Spirochaetaceae bacterium]